MNFCGYFFSSLKESVLRGVRLARLTKKYPNCRFYPGCCVGNQSVLGKYNVIFSNAAIIKSIIGDHTFIQKDSIVINAEIGKFCSISMGVSIGLGQHPVFYVSSHPAFYSVSQPLAKTFAEKDIFSPFKRVFIGHDVWIGKNAMIMDGVRIGTGAVIAAGAVVTKDIPEYAIAAGVPAKIIRHRFDDMVKNSLLESKWWDMPEDWLKEHADLFPVPLEFINQIKKHNTDNQRKG